MTYSFFQAACETAQGASVRKTVLNVGCGPRGSYSITPLFPAESWQEIRLDIDSRVEPDIVASITDMSPVPDGSVDAVCSSHNLEHLNPHEVPAALKEFLRVLRPGGILSLFVPDLQRVAQAVVDDRLEEPLYLSDAGPISPLDIIFGFRAAIAAGRHFMAHRTGFTPKTLGRAVHEAGFDPIVINRLEGAYELQVTAFRPPVPAALLQALANSQNTVFS